MAAGASLQPGTIMQIGSNTVAQTAAYALKNANAAVLSASERISTGLRVNRASDDPVGMMVANRIKTQFSSVVKAMDNVYQGVAMTEIVDSSLSSIVDVLANMRQTAVAAQSSTAASTDIAGYQNAMDAYVEQIDTLVGNAVWNGSSLMTSSSSTVNIQAGANTADVISIGLTKTNTTTLFGSYLSSGTLTISSTTAAATAVNGIDAALNTVNAYQSYMGAMANVMTSQSDALTNLNLNYSKAYGNIMNADMAQETVKLASAQIQRDAATAMLSQGNSMNKELVNYLLKSVTN